MKIFKKLLLSATTICTMSGVTKPADAFVFLKSHNTGNQQSSIAIHSYNKTEQQPSKQLANSVNHSDHSEDVAFLMPHLKEIVSIQGQDSKTLEAKQKERAQLLDYILQYKEMRNNQQAPANVPQQVLDHTQQLREEISALKEEIKQLRAHALGAAQEQHVRVKREEGGNELPDNKVVMARNEIEVMTTQIKSLSDQITQLQESHLNLNSSVSLLRTTYEERRDQLPLLPSASLPSTFSSSPTSMEDDEGTSKSNSSKAEATLPTVTETPAPLEETIDTNKLSAQDKIVWNKEDFIQISLGKKPDDLTSLTTDEMDLWKTFTLITFKDSNNASVSVVPTTDSEDPSKLKLWSTWGGTFTTAELEEKFKANGFMTRAFQIKKAISFKEDITDGNSEDIFTYFTNNKPEIKPETESDLVKAYYFRGLYRALTNYDGERGRLLSRTSFEIDLTSGIKGSHFKYVSDHAKASAYKTSISESEELFENTPWHQLFINQVQQATLNTINQKKNDLQKEYSAGLKNIGDEDDKSKMQTLLIESRSQYDTAVDLLKEMHKGVLKATSLREIDDALELRS